MVATRTEAWKRVTRHDPCPICQKDHWCRVSPDGAFVCCMFNFDQAHRIGQLKSGEPYALHRLRDDRPYEPQSPTFTTPTPEDDAGFDVLTARAVYAVTAAHCAAEIPDFVRAELVRRFGPVYGPLAIERFGLGYCNSPQLVKALDAVGRRTEALAAGVLHPQRGQAVHSLAGRITIPYRGGGGVLDIRGAGIKGRGETKEMSLPGGYIERDVVGTFFNHDALDNLAPGEPVHIAGGAYKTMALALCELPAIGTRGEGELSDAQIAALQAVGVTDVVLHIDAEEAKEGERLSSGRRLGLPKAERLAAAGFVVAIAEPAREPGTPKVDPDALLRDFGARAVRNYATSPISLEAWRVNIGVQPVGVPEEFAERLSGALERERKATRTLANVMQIRRNTAIKAERDALVASVLHMGAEQANGHVTPGGRIRQPLYIPAEAAGVASKTASRHLALGPQNGLFERQLLREQVIRRVDESTGERRNTLCLIDEAGTIVEECPAEVVFGVGGAPPSRSLDGDDGGKAYYVIPKHEPAAILDILVTLDPVKMKKNGEEKAGWGGKREPCPRCGSQRRRTFVTCADCELEFSNKVDEPAPEPDTVADVSERQGEPASIPPTPVFVSEPEAVYPSGEVAYTRVPTAPKPDTTRAYEAAEDDGADDWDPHFCNHIDHRGQQCTARIDPALGKRYCWQHRPSVARPTATASPTAPVGAAIILGGVRVGPPKRGAPATPPPMPVAPVAVGPLPRCMARGCAGRVERRGERYCHACANSGEGYENDALGAN